MLRFVKERAPDLSPHKTPIFRVPKGGLGVVELGGLAVVHPVVRYFFCVWGSIGQGRVRGCGEGWDTRARATGRGWDSMSPC